MLHTLQVSNLTKTFSSGWRLLGTSTSYTAVKGISFSIAKGEVVGLLGPNGAGKTTTIQMLLGTLTPTHGTITYFNRNFSTNRIDILTKVGYANGYDKLPARLTVTENLDIVGRIYNLPYTYRQERINHLVTTFGLEKVRHQQAGTLSAGQSTRAMLAKAFLANPDVVLLDEPTASLDPDIAYEVRQFILRECRERDISMLITSHNMHEVTELCDRVLVLKEGMIIANNSPELLAQSIAKVHVSLTIPGDHTDIRRYLEDQSLTCTVHEQELIIDLDEHAIAPFLLELGKRGIIYSHIAIDKPTLEDYFLSISSARKTNIQ